MEFDYIVIGAGSAGCIIADRLSASGRDRVLLLEAGPRDGYVHSMPLGYGLSFYDPRVNWMYWSEPEPALGGRRLYVPRGKILGGSSAINAMVYIRGNPADFDDWERAGNPGWGWADVAPVFARLEDRLSIETSEPGAHALCAHFLAAAQRLGLPLNADFNGPSQTGVGFYPVTISKGRRQSAASVFLRPALRRPNLAVLTGAQAQRIRLEGKRARAVEYLRGGVFEAQARREIIVSAGAVGSPQLLQLSGIGPPDLLRAHGLPVIAALPAGENLQDHASYDHYYRSRLPTMNEILRPWHGKVRAALAYGLLRRGPLANTMNHAGGFFSTRDGADAPHLQLYFCPSSYDRSPQGRRRMTEPDPFPGFSLSVSSCRPTSRGSVAVRSPDPREPPAIALNLLASEADLAEMLEGAKYLRRLARTPELAAIIDSEFKPGADIDGDAALIEDLRARSYSIFHLCGTCRMGPEPKTSVVDAALRVHGLSGLRVADASVFPNVTTGNINAPAMMVGLKAAEIIASV